MKRIVRGFVNINTRHPLPTSCILGFFIALIGDVGCQRFFETPSAENEKVWKWDSRRSVEMGSIRCFVVAPFIHAWYPMLVVLSPGTSVLRVLGRIALDQLLGSPVVICLVFCSSAIAKGRNPMSAFCQLREHGFSTWWAGFHFWPFVHFINFGFVPPKYQSIFSHFASVYWNAVLSYYSNFDVKKDVESERRIDT